jgi:hypothetical protein
MPYQIQNGVIDFPAGGAITAIGAGLAVNSGTISNRGTLALVGTAAGTVTIAPASNVTDVILTLPATGGGTVTVAAAPNFKFQSVDVHIHQGATLAHVSLNSGFVFGTAPASYADATQTINVVDHLEMVSTDGTKYLVQVANLNALT